MKILISLAIFFSIFNSSKLDDEICEKVYLNCENKVFKKIRKKGHFVYVISGETDLCKANNCFVETTSHDTIYVGKKRGITWVLYISGEMKARKDSLIYFGKAVDLVDFVIFEN